jgi:hypothetical protein
MKNRRGREASCQPRAESKPWRSGAKFVYVILTTIKSDVYHLLRVYQVLLEFITKFLASACCHFY